MTLNTSAATPVTQINYTVTFPDVQEHYVTIEMNISGLTQKAVDVKMPVWTPGSYLVREFAKNVENYTVEADGKPVKAYKTNKNTWHIENGDAKAIKFTYNVYCFEVSVRSSLVDATSAFLSTSGLFMFPEGMLHEPSTIHIKPYKGWSMVSTSLDQVNGDQFTLRAPDYDILYDSPIQVGNQDVFSFDVAGTKYDVAMCGDGNYDKGRLKTDLAKIITQEVAIFGENPNKHYVFIVHNALKNGGGLEHLSSTVLAATRNGYDREDSYHTFLALAAHEHFHLWNVKRLRPVALGPFDYEKENYTTNLWIAEGFTTYYQSVVIRRTNLYPVDDFLKITADNFTFVDNQHGSKIQSLNDASFDAWIKYYRPNENSPNSTISYYNKGAIVATLLDLEIIHNSKATKSLDDVMKYMYNEYYKNKHRGYTDAEFKAGLEKFTGTNLDDFYKKYIYGVADFDYTNLSYAGFKLTNTLAESDSAYLGVKITPANGKMPITNVYRNSPASAAGISANDELLLVDGVKITDLDAFIATKKPGNNIKLTLNRDGIQIENTVKLAKSTQVKYRIDDIGNLNAEQIAVRNKWLKLQ